MFSVLRRFVGVWLMADGIWTGIWFAGLASSMAGRDPVSVTATTARFVVGALSLTAGWFVSQRRDAGGPLGRTAAFLIAAFAVLDFLTRVLPGNLDPSFRGLVTWLQVAGAGLAIVVLRGERREKM